MGARAQIRQETGDRAHSAMLTWIWAANIYMKVLLSVHLGLVGEHSCVSKNQVQATTLNKGM